MDDFKKPRLDIVEYPQGYYIIREGEVGQEAYVLRSGEVEVIKKNSQGHEVVIAILGANEIFGEMCLFEDHSVRSASIRVISKRAEVLSITRSYFQSQIEVLPEGLRLIIMVLIRRLRYAGERIVLLT